MWPPSASGCQPARSSPPTPADEGVKLALIADDPAVFFTTPHFDGYSAVLFELDRIGARELTELITDAWLARAPKKLARDFLAR